MRNLNGDLSIKLSHRNIKTQTRTASYLCLNILRRLGWIKEVLVVKV
jgi:hypothetical protein